MKKFIFASLCLFGLSTCNHAKDTWEKYNLDKNDVLTKEEMKRGIIADMEDSEVAGSMEQIDKAVETILADHPNGISKDKFAKMFDTSEEEL